MIHVARVQFTTDAPIADAQVRAVSHGIVGEMNAALQAAGKPGSRVHIGELHLNLPHSTINDRQALAGYARSVAQQILERSDV